MGSSGDYITTVWLSLGEVLGRINYLILALILAFTAFAASVWMQNITLIIHVLTSSSFGVSSKASLMFTLLGGIFTNYETWAAALIVVMSVLFGINAALLAFAIVRRKGLFRAYKLKGTATVSASVSAFLGAGCASCGTYLLGAGLASVGGSGMIALLPFAGKEFLVSSIALLALSIALLAKQIQAKNVCT